MFRSWQAAWLAVAVIGLAATSFPQTVAPERDSRVVWTELVENWQVVAKLDRGLETDLEGLRELERRSRRVGELMEETLLALPFEHKRRFPIERMAAHVRIKLSVLRGVARQRTPGRISAAVEGARRMLWALQETFPADYLKPPLLEKPLLGAGEPHQAGPS